MNKTICRLAGIATLAAWLTGCGGDNGPAKPVPPPETPIVVTLGSATISASGRPETLPSVANLPIVVTGSTSDLYVGASWTQRTIERAAITGPDLEHLQFEMDFRDAGSLPNGTYNDTVTVHVCKDAGCAQPVGGSPFTVPVAFTVSGSSMAFVPAHAAPPTAFLTHDVVDAAMSKPLGLVLMASAQPANALFVYDVATGTERSIALSKAPTSLALSPDGRKVVVGHDALVSLVDLSNIANAAPVVRETPVATAVWDMVLDSNDVVQVYPAADQWVHVFTLDLDAGTAATVSAGAYAKTRARLHPSGNRLYTLDTLLSPENLVRFSITGGTLAQAGQSPYWGDWSMCGNFWFSEAGDRTYTACGNTFTSSPDIAQDMLYAGRVALSSNTGYYQPNLVWLDDSSALGEAAMLDAGYCGGQGGPDCPTLLRVTETQYDGLRAAWWLPPVGVDGDVHVQHGLFVWHRGDGSLLMLGRLAGITDPTRAYYLNAVAVNGGNGNGALALHASLRRAAAASRRAPLLAQ